MRPRRHIDIGLACIIMSLSPTHFATARGLQSGGQYWGAQTNGVKAGVFFTLVPGSSNQVQCLFVPALENSLRTNGNFAPDRLHLWLPPFDSRYSMELTDEAGKLVRKTKKGEALGMTYIQPRPQRVSTASPTDRAVLLTPNKPEVLPESVSKQSPFEVRSLCLQDYFKIRRSGKYHLRFQTSVLFWRTQTPWDLHLVSLPPVEAELDLKLPPPCWVALVMSSLGLLIGNWLVIVGLACCVAGVLWLVLHRRRMRPT